MTETNVKTKTWSTIAVYETYEEALAHKDTIKDQHELVKIKACNKTKNNWSYKIKVWSKPEEKTNKKSKKSKKGKKQS
ncbi:MAG TPA: hypothetical protein EYG21_00010 [Nitrospinaceae bacterium]|mgnify:CR=1 FL=1|jgi:hypothetical protein|nr:hypothetical protein [Nitrospinaceae bacterium]